MNNTPDVPFNERINRNMNALLLLAAAFAFPCVVLLRRNIGRRYAGLQAMLSMTLLFFWPVLDPTCDPRPMLGALVATIALSVFARLQGLRRNAGGHDPEHRLYDGYPRLMRLFFFCRDEVKFKRFLEPLLIFGTAQLVGLWNPLLMYFGSLSAVGLFLVANAGAFAERERIEAMRDQYRDQQHTIERFRRAGGK
ncbi:MAG: hypothetical protein JWM57_997 [Phycisphaerales bacterium]|nr:hypothetical protein [Phycisphaerales bacterium]